MLYDILCLFSQTSKVLHQSDEHPGQAELKMRQVMTNTEVNVLYLKVKSGKELDSSSSCARRLIALPKCRGISSHIPCSCFILQEAVKLMSIQRTSRIEKIKLWVKKSHRHIKPLFSHPWRNFTQTVLNTAVVSDLLHLVTCV